MSDPLREKKETCIILVNPSWIGVKWNNVSHFFLNSAHSFCMPPPHSETSHTAEKHMDITDDDNDAV